MARQRARTGIRKRKPTANQLEYLKLRLEIEQYQLENHSLRSRLVKRERRSYTFIGEVNERRVKRCMYTMGQLSLLYPGAPLTLNICSPGGETTTGLALYDYLMQLRSAGHELTTVALGWTASMGGILLQAGNKRLIGANAVFHIHEPAQISEGSLSEIEDDMHKAHIIATRLAGILAHRSTLSASQIKKKWKGKDWWLGAADAVELGFADEVIGISPSSSTKPKAAK